MFNFYPWGLSINVVQRSVRSHADRLRCYAGTQASSTPVRSGLDRVEMEDEAIVEAVQRGVRSRFYRRGRFSPTRERGVHHFQRLLCEFL